ncbi:hypothetical protein J6590_037343 [Homalodisca vitripennis]|nr:hypothetical protein J6590_037343 [Homalodisca vitripennis]
MHQSSPWCLDAARFGQRPEELAITQISAALEELTAAARRGLTGGSDKRVPGRSERERGEKTPAVVTVSSMSPHHRTVPLDDKTGTPISCHSPTGADVSGSSLAKPRSDTFRGYLD